MQLLAVDVAYFWRRITFLLIRILQGKSLTGSIFLFIILFFKKITFGLITMKGQSTKNIRDRDKRHIQ